MNKYWVGSFDLNILLDGWKDTDYVDPETDPWIAADFDHSEEGLVNKYRIGSFDLNILLENWKDDSGVSDDCLDY